MILALLAVTAHFNKLIGFTPLTERREDGERERTVIMCFFSLMIFPHSLMSILTYSRSSLL